MGKAIRTAQKGKGDSLDVSIQTNGLYYFHLYHVMIRDENNNNVVILRKPDRAKHPPHTRRQGSRRSRFRRNADRCPCFLGKICVLAFWERLGFQILISVVILRARYELLA